MPLKTRSIIWRTLADQLADNELTIVWPLEGCRQYPSDHWDVSAFGLGEWRRLYEALGNDSLELRRWTDGLCYLFVVPLFLLWMTVYYRTTRLPSRIHRTRQHSCCSGVFGDTLVVL